MTAPEPTVADTGATPDDLGHWTCCEHPDRALCGTPLAADAVELPDDIDPECIVCDDLVVSHVCPVYRSCLVVEP